MSHQATWLPAHSRDSASSRALMHISCVTLPHRVLLCIACLRAQDGPALAGRGEGAGAPTQGRAGPQAGAF